MPSTLIKLSLLMRYTRRVSDGFDVVFGVHNETDYGRRGIQYVHYPTYLRPRPKVDLRWYHPPQAGLNLYYALADRIADFSLDRMKANLTLVNSDWTGEHVSTLSRHQDADALSTGRRSGAGGCRGASGATPFLPSAASHRKRNTSAS